MTRSACFHTATGQTLVMCSGQKSSSCLEVWDTCNLRNPKCAQKTEFMLMDIVPFEMENALHAGLVMDNAAQIVKIW